VKNTDEHGFVVVSFGAGVKYLSDDIAQKLAGALSRLPQRVIWRYCHSFLHSSDRWTILPTDQVPCVSFH